MAIAGLHNASAFGPSFFGDSRPSGRASALLQMWRELENEHIVAGSCGTRHPLRTGSDIECSSCENGSDSSSSIVSDDLGETERERVRQIFQEWMNSGSKGRFRKIEEARGGLAAACLEKVATKPIRRLCGRQTLLNLVRRARGERDREISGLIKSRPVSDFAYRHRIQALLRGRFLRNENVVGDERPSLRGATELGLLRERHTVSDLREGFLSKLDNSTTSTNTADPNHTAPASTCLEKEVTNVPTILELESGADRDSNTQKTKAQTTKMHSRVSYDEARDQDEFHGSQQLSSNQEDPSPHIEEQTHLSEVNNEPPLEYNVASLRAPCDVFSENCTTDSRENTDEGQDDVSNPGLFDNDVEEQDDTVEDRHANWSNIYLKEAIESWLDMPSGKFGMFSRPDDECARSIELKDLYSRKRVSSLLRSSFRESLNRVLQSHVERRLHTDWVDQDHEQLLEDDQRNEFGHPPWSDQQFRVLSRSHHQPDGQSESETDWEMINELKVDMARLQERINDVQSMLEACMEMQMELLRSVHHKLSPTINRPATTDDDDKSGWDHIRKGICCCCRDNKINSLLYKCGHMCLCSFQVCRKFDRLQGKVPNVSSPGGPRGSSSPHFKLNSNVNEWNHAY